MNTTNIIQRMIDDKIAANVFQAAHIANGLHLALLKDETAQVKRYKLYRKWRDAGEPSKVAYANAIEEKIPIELSGCDSGDLSDDEIAEETKIAIDNGILEDLANHG